MRGGLYVAALLLAFLGGCAGQRLHAPVPVGNPSLASAHAGALSVTADTRVAGPGNSSLPQADRYQDHQDGGPLRPPAYIATLPEPVPYPEPRSPYGNKSPYTVNGHTYHVLDSATGYDQRGIASWYGDKFQGYLTSNFEKYDMYKFTAASKVLPLPTWARVTNLQNGKSVIVRVNDRGPFVPDRIIDLSYAAAVRIGIWPRGTGLVRVQAIDPQHPHELPPVKVISMGGKPPDIWLQVGAFADAANARRLVRRLRAAGLGPVELSRIRVRGRNLHRVRVGPFTRVSVADRLSRRIRHLGLPQPKVAVD